VASGGSLRFFFVLRSGDVNEGIGAAVAPTDSDVRRLAGGSHNDSRPHARGQAFGDEVDDRENEGRKKELGC
jgi:hypothetical protein